jgi:YfiR/HmsC-like
MDARFKMSGALRTGRISRSGSSMDASLPFAGSPLGGKRAWLFWALVALAGIAAPVQQALGDVSEYELKAAFLSSFAQFTKWPAGTFSDASAPFVIGIIGEDPFGGSLEKIVQARGISGRKVVVRRGRSAGDMRSCQIVYVAKSERGHLGEIIAGLQGAGILTVGESDQFTRQGGAIGFKMEGDKVRFEINAAAAQRAGLQISSRLLKLAGGNP